MGQMRVKVRLQMVMEMNNSIPEKVQKISIWAYFKPFIEQVNMTYRVRGFAYRKNRLIPDSRIG